MTTPHYTYEQALQRLLRDVEGQLREAEYWAQMSMRTFPGSPVVLERWKDKATYLQAAAKALRLLLHQHAPPAQVDQVPQTLHP